MREQRKLAAVLAADVVGYSRLMGRDEAGTLARLKEHRAQRLEPALAGNGGRLVKLTGDGALAEFGSAVDALRAAIEFQQAVANANAARPEEQRIVFRIGLHVGDLIVDGDDLYGDGVNIAARLEGEAPPGGIVVSGALHDAAAGKLPAHFVDLGPLSLKNIDRHVQAYRVEWKEGRQQSPDTPASPGTTAPLPLPDKPSIAVLPFQNMSGDPEQEYFADGIVEDIITALSRFKSLFVIARNSSFAYKGRAVDIKQVGRELGVRYVLEGSVRKAGNRVRITGQLIDGQTGAHLWADRFDGAVEDVFDLQDRITASVVGAIVPTLDQVEIDRAAAKSTGSLGSYDHLLRGMANLHLLTKEGTGLALDHLREAIRLDPTFSAAYGWACIAYSRRRQSRWMLDIERESEEGTRLGRKAIELAKDDAFALSTGGFAIAFLGGDLDAGLAFIDRGLALNPNLAAAWQASGWIRSYIGDPDTAIEHLTLAMRLSPLDPQMPQLCIAMAVAMRCAGRYPESAEWAKKALGEVPDLFPALISLAAAQALAGQLDDARQAAQRALQIDPGVRMSAFHNIFFRRPQDRAAMREGLRLAGIPE